MNILITGGAGFIGSHLAEYLLHQGHRVFIIDNLSTGSFENILHLKNHERFQYTIDSIMNVPLTAELVDRCDLVFHLAAAVGVKLIVESPVYTIETNVKGTEIVLDLANKKKKTVVVASTSEVYGKANKIPFSEDDDLVLGPTHKGRWSYACSKAVDEFLAFAYQREKRLPVIIVRLFNTVGPRQTGQYGMVLPTFVKQALQNCPITVYGDGSQSRCFTHVNDVVDALYKLALKKEAIGQVFNIGSDEEVTIRNLAERVRAIACSNSPIQFVPYEEAYEEGFEDMRRRIPDIRKIQQLIGYRPTQNLEQIIESVVHFCRNCTAPGQELSYLGSEDLRSATG
ncbi:MAG: GDP-mannose 4,6-dehydratase [Acidobacteria bacterium]|nr:GDP-mannose 4,6-dehydratase [Acidobacteriota bacterium]